MDIGVVGAGIAGLSAAWYLRRAGHRVVLFERNYKPGGRMNSRRKAGLVVDHGDRYWRRSDAVLYELIVESGLQGELRSIDLPVFDLGKDGALCESVEKAIDQDRVVFPNGLLSLPEALRRTVGGLYSLGVVSVIWEPSSAKFQVHTDPPIRLVDTEVDAVVFACPAPEALGVSEPIQGILNPAFVTGLRQVEYTRSLVMIAAMEAFERPGFYGVRLPQGSGSFLSWLAFEDQKCQGRQVEGWASMVLHLNPEASEANWDRDEDELIEQTYSEARRLVPQLPERWRWARFKRWPLGRLRNAEQILYPEKVPAADADVLVEFCGDYRAGDGVEAAASSGRAAAESLLAKMAHRVKT